MDRRTRQRAPQQRTPQRRSARPRRRRNKLLPLLGTLLVGLIAAGAVFWGVQPRNAATSGLLLSPSESIFSSAGSALLPESTELTPAESNGQLAEPGPYDVLGLPPLYNRNNPLPEGYAPELVSVGQYSMETQAAQAFLAMQAAAADNGIEIVAVSAYRPTESQTRLFNQRMQEKIDQGMTEEEAYAETALYTAPPGTSEHESGLAVDINWVDTSFKDTAAYAWLQENAATYGFIMRYPLGDKSITGVEYEPWHYRYVGANHAGYIWQHELTLEEYLGAPPVEGA